MNVSNYPDYVTALCNTCQTFGERGWCRATSGNFSCRVDKGNLLITQSGCDKSSLQSRDLMLCDAEGNGLESECKPSTETALHCRLYQVDPTIGAVFHTHSVTATALSRIRQSPLMIKGYEMQKALAGYYSHESEIKIRIFENNQDMDALANQIETAWSDDELVTPGFLIAGHGLYAWGTDIDQARRHLEGLEFLLECQWQESLIN